MPLEAVALQATGISRFSHHTRLNVNRHQLESYEVRVLADDGDERFEFDWLDARGFKLFDRLPHQLNRQKTVSLIEPTPPTLTFLWLRHHASAA